MWWIAAKAVTDAFDITLYPLRQLMTPFHENSDNFYGDVGQVKVAVRQDSSPIESTRLRQLARQVSNNHVVNLLTSYLANKGELICNSVHSTCVHKQLHRQRSELNFQTYVGIPNCIVPNSL
jgi:hypothetical protein